MFYLIFILFILCIIIVYFCRKMANYIEIVRQIEVAANNHDIPTWLSYYDDDCIAEFRDQPSLSSQGKEGRRRAFEQFVAIGSQLTGDFRHVEVDGNKVTVTYKTMAEPYKTFSGLENGHTSITE